MTEMLCTDPMIFEESQGKGVCNPKFAEKYKDNNNCNKCPKANRAYTSRAKRPDVTIPRVKTPNVKYER